MTDYSHRIREELVGIVAFVGAIWAVFLLRCAVRVAGVDLNAFGLVPRTLSGLAGIPAMPFLHASLGHLLSNTPPLFILLALLAGSRARSWETVAEIVVVGGVLLWVFGRPAVHIGASGLVFGLVTFLVVSGFLERRTIPLIVSVVVGFLYGGTLLANVLPTVGPYISWDGHLCGAVAGVVIAYALTRERKRNLRGESG